MNNLKTLLHSVSAVVLCLLCVRGQAQVVTPSINNSLYTVLPEAVNTGVTGVISFTSGLATSTIDASSIPGEQSVSLSGGMTYTIPIEVPPGTNGMQPTLAVGYSSQAGNGLMGIGWNLSGGSAITRVNKTVAQDAWAGPVKLDINDAIAFDGSRLVLMSGTYGAQNSTYATENETYALITLKGGDLASATCYFEVITKSGMTMEYGKENNAAFKSSDATNAKIILWQINKTTDPFGNYMTYTYEATSASARQGKLVNIDYTGNTAGGLVPYQRVSFNYTLRTLNAGTATEFTDKTTAYIAGSSVEAFHLLTAIRVCDLSGTTSTPAIVYEFKYGKGVSTTVPVTGFQLINVRQQRINTAGVWKYVNGTAFSYGALPTALIETKAVNKGTATPGTTSTGGFLSNHRYLSGDFNADGMTDVLECQEYTQHEIFGDWPEDGWTYDYESKVGNYRYISNGTAAHSLTIPDNIYFYQNAPYKTLNNEVYRLWTQSAPLYSYFLHDFSEPILANADFNGDGKDDLLVAKYQTHKTFRQGILEPNNEVTYFRGYEIYTNLDVGQGVLMANKDFPFSSLSPENYNSHPINMVKDLNNLNAADSRNMSVMEVGDFDGDGKMDILTILRTHIAYVENPNNGTTPNADIKVYISFPSKNQHFIPILFANNKLQTHYINTGSSTDYPVNLRNQKWILPKIIDIDGDGKNELAFITTEKTRIVSFNNYPTDVVMFDFNAINLLATGVVDNIDMANNSKVLIQTGDFNGDGKTDFLVGNPHLTGANAAKIYYSTGTGFTAATALPAYQLPATAYYDEKSSRTLVADFNGDGKSDIAVSMNNSATGSANIVIYYSNGNGSFDIKQQEVTQNLDNYWTVGYDGKNFGSPVESMGLGDFNGDGQVDFLSRVAAAGNVAQLQTFTPNNRQNLLSQIKDGMGNLTKIDYRMQTQPLAKMGNVGVLRLANPTNSVATGPDDPIIDPFDPNVCPNKPADTYTYPRYDHNRAMYVVRRVTVPSAATVAGAANTTTSTVYQFKRPVIDVTGRGFLGFAERTVKDSLSGVSTYTNTRYAGVLGTPKFQSSNTFLPTSGAPMQIAYTENFIGEYEIARGTISTNKTYIVRPTISFARDFKTLANTATYMTYGAYNNPALKTTMVYSGAICPLPDPTSTNAKINTEVTMSDYVAVAPSTIPVLPGIITTNTTLTGTGTLTSSKQTQEELYYSFNKPYYNTTSGRYGIDLLTTIAEQYIIYDVYGNPTNKTQYSTTGAELSQSFEYDPTRRYITKTTNQTDVTNAYFETAQSKRIGKPSKVINAASMQTDYFYDALGRTVAVKELAHLTGTAATKARTTSNQFQWRNAALIGLNPRYTLTTSTTTTEPGGTEPLVTNCSTPNTAYYDQFNRLIANSAPSLSGVIVSDHKLYDVRGRVSTEKASYFVGQTAIPVSTNYTYYDAVATATAANYGQILEANNGVAKTTYTYETGAFGNTYFLTLKTEATQIPVNPATGATSIATNYTDALGRTIETRDNGGILKHTYDVKGLRKTELTDITDAIANRRTVATLDYNISGLKTSLIDPNAGTTTYAYDGFDRLSSQTTPKGAYSFVYDNLGRITSKTTGTGATQEITTYTFNNTVGTAGYGQLTEEKITVNAIEVHKITYLYNALQQLEKQTETVEGGTPANTKTFVTDYVYDLQGRLSVTKLPSAANVGLGIKRTYDANSYIVQKDAIKTTDNTVLKRLYELKANDVFGHKTQYRLLEGATKVKKYNEYGLPTGFYAGVVSAAYTTAGIPADITGLVGTTAFTTAMPTATRNQDYEFEFNKYNSNLNTRKDNIKRDDINNTGRYEDFTYDNQDRLVTTKLFMGNGTAITGANLNMAYDFTGNMIGKSDIDDLPVVNPPTPYKMVYDPNKKNALINTDNKKTLISGLQQDITFTAFSQPKQIKEATTATPTGSANTLDYLYATDEQRIKSNLVLAATPNDFDRRYYLGNYELSVQKTAGITKTRHIYYIGDIIMSFEEPATGTAQYTNYEYYATYTDHLGSLLTVTGGKLGATAITQEYNYDAWGRDRIATGANAWTYPTAPLAAGSLPWLTRGYTGHEHLRTFGLINMNGRLYDPAAGRMLSADNETHEGTQGYNRYSYVMNNPLKYTDPSGENPIIIGALIAGGINIAFNWEKIANTKGGIDMKIAAALSYGLNGVASAAITGLTGNLYAGGVALESFNIITDAVTGNIPTFKSKGEAELYLGGRLGGAVIGAGLAKHVIGPVLDDMFSAGFLWYQQGIRTNLNAAEAAISSTPYAYGVRAALTAEGEAVAQGGARLISGIVNRSGKPYPKVDVPGYGEVPFPNGPYTPNNSKLLRPDFDKIRNSGTFKEWWLQQGLAWPDVPEGSTINIHHIQPLSKGGTNAFDNLVPLIQPEQHQPFTNWWRSYP